jgi:Protein of unknown function (DUF1549)/Protein of unknown function (DUF1553)/Bacterial Ig-like domain (group 2)
MISMRRLATYLLATIATAVTATAEEPIRLPGGATLKAVDFERHVAPLLGQLGCNAGACHGSFQGKGGFRLSLFGYDPGMDYRALTRGSFGRRVNPSSPDDSLLLQKPTMQMPHEGGQRLKKDSWQHRIIRRWIADGAKRTAGSGNLRQLSLQPAELKLIEGRSQPLTVSAQFAHGSKEDVTPFCRFRVQNDAVALVSADGVVTAGVPGDTAVIAEYAGQFATMRVLVPVAASKRLPWPRAGTESGPYRVDGFIDDEVFAKLRQLGITPSERCSDADFLRRLTLDTIGRVPTPGEVRAFLKDARPDKRRRMVDRLLSHPMHAALWATRLCDIMGNDLDVLPGSQEMRPKYAKMWHDWLRRRIANNTPYDEIVRGILAATSRGKTPLKKWISRRAAMLRKARTSFDSDYARQPSLDLYWTRPPDKLAEITAAAFLGVRIECAQCHKHPFDRWTQTDYRAFVNVFAPVQYGSSPELRAAVVDLLDARRKLRAAGKPLPPPLPRLQEVFLSRNVEWQKDPRTDAPLPPKALGGPVLSHPVAEAASFRTDAGSVGHVPGDARRELFRWLVRPDNPYFARTFVNRVWAHYFGRGLVHPVDDFSVVNPPSNAKLLDRLAREFVKSGFDIRRLERAVLNSQTYQLAAKPNRTNRWDRTNFSRAYVRALPAEVAVDSLVQATGIDLDFGRSVPAGSRAIEVAPSRIGGTLGRLFNIFERPARKTVCDCERRGDPSIRQSLFLMTDATVLKGIESGRLKSLLASNRSDDAVIDELFLATFARFPSKEELAAIRKYVAKNADRRKAFTDVFWGLLNSREFLTNH